MRQNTVGNIMFYDLIVTCKQLVLLYENTNLDWHSDFTQGLIVLLKQKTAMVPTRIPPEDGEEGCGSCSAEEINTTRKELVNHEG